MLALGVLVGLLSACIQSIGLTLQRKSHLLEDTREEEFGFPRRPPYRRRRWQIGMFIFLVSNIVGSTIQITTLPLPVLSTLQASGLVFNTACATLILDEPFTKFSILGTLLVAGGAVLIALFGAMAEPSHNLDQLLDLLGYHQFLIWLFGSLFVVGVILVIIWLQERVIVRHTHRTKLMLGLAYGSVSGILSAHTLLVAKSAVELLVRTIVDRINQFNRWQSWMILVGLVIIALSQLYFLHRGLKLCSTSVLYPFVFCIYNIVAILDGLIYFRQTSRLSLLHALLVALGTVILLAGVFALSWRLGPEYQSEDTQDADTKALARVQTSHGALGPGLGLIETEEPISVDIPPTEEETSLRHHDLPSESTPLLRSRTTPSSRWRISKAPARRSTFRPPRLRRLTVPEETTDLWDELNNDSNESRRFSGNFSPQFHRSSSSPRLGSTRTKNRHSSSSASNIMNSPTIAVKNLIGSVKWPTWRKQIAGSTPTINDTDTLPPHENTDGEDTDEADAGGTVRRYPRSSALLDGQSRSDGHLPQSASGGWFKLRWWKGKRKWWDSPRDEEVGDADSDSGGSDGS